MSADHHQTHPPGYSLDDDDDDDVPASPPHAPAQAEPAPAPAPAPLPVPTPPPSDPQHAATPPPPTTPPPDEFADPKIASLHAIFPDFDAAILYSVVDSVGGSEDRAIDALLAMSDPAHVPAAPPPAPAPMSQTQLDEEFARQLMLETRRRSSRQRGASLQGPEPQQPQQQQGQGQGPQRDTMADVQEQFSKLAESGKRTFSTFVSKVKAKVQEFDQSRNAQGGPAGGTQPTWGQQQQQQQEHSPRSPPQTPSPGALDRHAQAALYAPRVAPVSPESSPVPPPQAFGETPPPPATGAGRPAAANIDPGKIGLLPKRPVSLVGAPAGARHSPDEDEDDEEELEYVENPFEEGRHS
ncbi:hypothetical protein BC834DRAFT_968262 [Gloeopeniophorella convolvens]|nr:hypothetical protein BC834DRAFT_968262 [Gloeopeniophorella convolvens]